MSLPTDQSGFMGLPTGQSGFMGLPRSVTFERGSRHGEAQLLLLDQTCLPMRGEVLSCRRLEEVEAAITSLAVRGAPALGCTAAYALALWTCNESTHGTCDEYLDALEEAAQRIASARPTAINLRREAEGLVAFARTTLSETTSVEALKEAVVEQAYAVHAREDASCEAIGAEGASLLDESTRVLTICNTGMLATASIGTALGVVYTAYAQGKIDHVWVCETRPVNQGSRLTAWELATQGLPHTLIADSMAATVMEHGWVNVVLVGADRICANGDTANKVGTLNLAVLAQHYGIPFYVCAPSSSVDPATRCASEMLIEQRGADELTGFLAKGLILPQSASQVTALDMLTKEGRSELTLRNGQQLALERKGGGYAFDAWFATAPPGVEVYNPAFDVTPAALITGIITEKGLHTPPYDFS